MMKFRRSTKSSSKSTDLRPQISIPEKSLVAIQPPKKVIRALYDYQVQDPSSNPGYLSFTQGEFLHVVSRENDPDWYEACNPLHGSRGLVPVNYFEEVGKQARKSAPAEQSSRTASVGGQGHDSGFAERGSQRSSVNGSNAESEIQARLKNMNMGRSVAMIYGMVLYDFKAERPDELDARAGENIIVIAQSTPEWFVAKPITRLGGPGLIPVGFVEIRDTATGKPVPNTEEAIARAGIPKVEEWKKMAADYKNSSIPLGRLDAQNQSLQQSMERLSVASNARPSHDARRSAYDSAPHQQQQQSQQKQFRTSQMISPVRAKVPGYSHHHGDFWFEIEAVMEDGRFWNLKRSYKDFYGLQLGLIDQFPEAAGKVEGYRRTLPYMPGPLPWVTENLTSERRGHLDQYLTGLLKIDSSITNSQIVRGFFFPRGMDAELQGDDDDASFRHSAGSHSSAALMPNSSHSSTGTLGMAGSGSGYIAPQRSLQHLQQQQSLSTLNQKAPPGNLRVQSDQLRIPNGATPPLIRNHSAQTLESMNSHGSANQPAPASRENPNSAATPVKVKVWFGESNCVVIRLAPDFNHADLVAKLRERWSLEPGVDRASVQDVTFNIEYRDEPSQGFYRIEGDEDLSEARDRNEKLTLRVGPALDMV